MPTYEYECKKCEEIIEARAGMNDDLLKVCPCGKKGKLQIIVSGGQGFTVRGGTPKYHPKR